MEQGHAWNEAAGSTVPQAHVMTAKTAPTQGRYGSPRGAALLKALVPEWMGPHGRPCPFRSDWTNPTVGTRRALPAHAESLMELTQDRTAIEFGRSGFWRIGTQRRPTEHPVLPARFRAHSDRSQEQGRNIRW